MQSLKQKIHQTIRKVTDDIDKRFRFNTAIAAMMELVNDLYKVRDSLSGEEFSVVKEAVETLIIMLSPFVPHIAEELWNMLGNKKTLFNTPWPAYDPAWCEQAESTIAVQVNGKLRATITVPKDEDQSEVESMAMAESNVKRFLEGTSVKRIIYVPNKIINIIAAPH